MTNFFPPSLCQPGLWYFGFPSWRCGSLYEDKISSESSALAKRNLNRRKIHRYSVKAALFTKYEVYTCVKLSPSWILTFTRRCPPTDSFIRACLAKVWTNLGIHNAIFHQPFRKKNRQPLACPKTFGKKWIPLMDAQLSYHETSSGCLTDRNPQRWYSSLIHPLGRLDKRNQGILWAQGTCRNWWQAPLLASFLRAWWGHPRMFSCNLAAQSHLGKLLLM